MINPHNFSLYYSLKSKWNQYSLKWCKHFGYFRALEAKIYNFLLYIASERIKRREKTRYWNINIFNWKFCNQQFVVKVTTVFVWWKITLWILLFFVTGQTHPIYLLSSDQIKEKIASSSSLKTREFKHFSNTSE